MQSFKPDSARQAAILYAWVEAVNQEQFPTIEFLSEWSRLPRHVVEREVHKLAARAVEYGYKSPFTKSEGR